MNHQPTTAVLRDGLLDNPPAQKLAWAMAVAQHARDGRWTPEEVARTLQMLGLDSLPPVHRALTRHGHVAGLGQTTPEAPAEGGTDHRAAEAPAVEGIENLLAAVLTVSLADTRDDSVLAALESTPDGRERFDLLTGRGVTPALAAGYAGLEAALVRLAFTDPDAALDGIAARAGRPATGDPGSPEEAA
jgi:hypothetical protein